MRALLASSLVLFSALTVLAQAGRSVAGEVRASDGMEASQSRPVQGSGCTSTGPYDVIACGGAYGDLAHARCKLAEGTRTLTQCTDMSAPFTPAMVGEPIYIAGSAGAGFDHPKTLKGTIASYISPASVLLSIPASKSATPSPINVLWGHDDTSAIQRSYNAAFAEGRPLYLPAGQYLHHGLNFTSNAHTGKSQAIIFGDAYGSTNLFALDVTDPESSQPYTLSVGIDFSVSSQTTVRDIAFIGGFGGAEAFADMAPAVNVFCARQAQSDGNALSILHTWNGVYTETQGPYDVVWDGCEQTNMVDSHFQTNGPDPVAALYLTNVNTPGFASPWVRVIARGAGSGNTMTKLSISGGRTSFVGRGNMVVLDEGSTNGIYQLTFQDGYSYMSPPVNGGPCNFLSDTAPDSKSYIRTVKLDQFYVEGSGPTCRVVDLRAQAVQWTLIGTQRYPTRNTVPNFEFNGGFLSSYAQVDGLYAMPGKTPVLAASSCKGSILQLGPLNQNPPGCSDYAFLANTNRFVPGIASNGSSLRGYPFPPSNQIRWVKLGTWDASGIGDTLHITIDATGGEQSRAGQQGFIEVAAAIGNTQAAPNVTGISAWAYGTSPALVEPSGILISATGGSISPANNSWDIWVHEQAYCFGTYRVYLSDDATWTPLGTAGTPPSGPYAVPGNIFHVSTGR